MKQKKIIPSIVLYFLLSVFPAISQDCKCDDEFLFIEGFLQTNYPGYPDKVTDKTLPEYKSLVDDLLSKATGTKDHATCIWYIGRYIGYFRDGHIQLAGNMNWEDLDENSQKEIITKRETIKLSVGDLEKLKTSAGTEGIWWTPDSTYQVAIIKHPNQLREYAGIILHSANPNWSEGQVKIELAYTPDGQLDGVMYYANHQPHYVKYTIHENQLGGGWVRHGSESLAIRRVNVHSQKLSDSTLYFQIGTFMEWNAQPIDSMVIEHRTKLETMPNLIIDVRDNGGGSSFSAMPLLPYIYTDPIHFSGSDVLATEQNLAAWEVLMDNPHIPEEWKESLLVFFEKMRSNPGKFIEASPDTTITMDSVASNPRRVVVLYNRNSASAAEIFLIAARQSSKVTLMGENSAGILDYADMRGADLSCLPYNLNYATTRSRAIDKGEGIDNIGIPPHKHFGLHQDWIEEARKWLEE